MLLEAEAFYSLTRPPETTFYMKEILQDSSILHYKGSLSRKLFYIQKAKRSSIDSTYRRQRFSFQSSCSTHPCMLQGLPKALQDIQDIHPFQGNSTCIQDFQGSTPLQLLQPECIFYTSAGFHIKLHQVPVDRLQTF